MQTLMVVDARNSGRTQFSVLSENLDPSVGQVGRRDYVAALREPKPIIIIGFRLHPELSSSTAAVNSPRLLIFFL